MPGADVGIRAEDPTIAELLKPLGYATGQFGKNHLGDKDEFLPTVPGFDEFFGNLYHLNAEEEPEDPDYPKDPAFKKQFGPRGVLHCWQTARADKRSTIPARSPGNGWRRSTTRSPTVHSLSSTNATRRESHFSFGTTLRACTFDPLRGKT